MLKLALASLVFLTSSAVLAADGDDALFGLKWGMSISEIRSTGSTLTKSRGDRNLETYKTSTVPRPLSDFESYMLIFADGKLVKLWGIGKDIPGDPTGSSGKERFETLRAALKEKYGQSTQNYQTIGNKLFKEYDEFYQCLAYSGCGMWVSTFETQEKAVILELKGLKRGIGYLEITAESKPQWSNALEIYKSKKANSDKDAL